MSFQIPMVQNNSSINVNDLLNEKIFVIDDFYKDLEWIHKKEILRTPAQGREGEQIIHLAPLERYLLLKEVSNILPEAFYPTDTGWIRSNNSTERQRPMSSFLHADHPYLVISVCLSSPEEEDLEASHGTTFYEHVDLGFKKINGHKYSQQFEKVFHAHKNDESKWKPWFKYSFKKNRAIIYDGSLLHRMPYPVFGNSLENSRLMQIFNFRLPKRMI